MIYATFAIGAGLGLGLGLILGYARWGLAAAWDPRSPMGPDPRIRVTSSLILAAAGTVLLSGVLVGVASALARFLLQVAPIDVE